MDEQRPSLPPMQGRGTSLNPANRFECIDIQPEMDWLDETTTEELLTRRVRTQYLVDTSREILSRNESPDLPFRYSLNPYRGCEHGCIYCYARPTHEYLGFSAGLDFETRIMVKREAPRLLERALRAPRWTPEPIMLSGNTDCYQPVERRLALTRGCLEVLLRFGNPAAVITKNALILRDLDVLAELARRRLVVCTLSVTTLDPTLAEAMEPRGSRPEKRLEAIERLAAAGIPTTVNVAPVIPGLTDHETPAILKAAAARGAVGAGYILLRLPHGVKELFAAWLHEHVPERAARVLHAVEDTRGGRLNDPRFGTRHSGTGARADAIAHLFALHCRRLGLETRRFDLITDGFRRPDSGRQLDLPL
ncbi:MAG: PA0069 family radical SAM protein [Candidatus Lambdaproteobacteria bacterium]|nr:PA0069 family radical SAM protein [Candidatus Lambdaproteobacteria bacterium]